MSSSKQMLLKVLVVLLVVKWGATQYNGQQLISVESTWLNAVQENLVFLGQKMDLSAKERTLTSQMKGIFDKLNNLERNFDAIRTKNTLVTPSPIATLSQQMNESNMKLNALEGKLNVLADSFNTYLASIKPDKLQNPSGCVEIFAKKQYNRGDGSYTIQMDASLPAIRVYCMADPNGGLPWTIVQRRVSKSVDSNRSFDEYKNGFGSLARNFFVGLKNLNVLTTEGEPQELWLKVTAANGKTVNAYYDNFVIGNETEGYLLESIGTYSGDAGDLLTELQGKQFSTFQSDDYDSSNCEEFFPGTWCQLNGSNGSTKMGQSAKVRRANKKAFLIYSHVGIRPSQTLPEKLINYKK